MTRALIAVVFTLAVAWPAWAQEGTTVETVLTTTQREGTVRSGSKQIDASMAASNVVAVRLRIATADYIDPTRIIWVRLFRSFDNGATWIAHGGMRWTGGSYVNEQGEVNPMPWFEVPITQIRGQLIQVEIDTRTRTRVGAELVY